MKTENLNKTNINWYPGHMAKTKRLISESINLIDIVYEVIDARIPYSSKMRDIDDILKNKPRILIVTKMDLCDVNETNKFINDYKNKGYSVIPMDLMNGKNMNEIIDKTKEILKPLDAKRLDRGLLKRCYRALIVGIPNVGKSTLINRLVGKKATKVGNMPGVTKSLSWIRINKDIDLMDSPGILWPRLDEAEVALNLASTSAIKEEILKLQDIAIHILKKLNDYYPNILKDRYKVDSIDINNMSESLEEIGRKKGCLSKGNNIDLDKLYSMILKDLREGNIKNITLDRYKD